MGFTNKAQYLTALLRLLPFGLLALYYGIQGLVVETKISSLNKVEGEVVLNGTKNIYSKLSNMRKDAYVFQINDNNDTIECYTFVTKYREKLSTIGNIKGDYVTLWCDYDDNNIRQVKINSQLLIEFSRPIFINLFFVILGGVYTVVTLLYLIKYPEHLFNKKKGKK